MLTATKNLLENLVMPIAVSNELIFFLITGIAKIVASTEPGAPRLAVKTGIPDDLAKSIIFIVGIIEILAALLVFYGALTENYHLASIVTYVLMFSTFVTALVMYTSPMNYGLIYIDLVFFKKLF